MSAQIMVIMYSMALWDLSLRSFLAFPLLLIR
jgi:hypothetical protein